MICGNGNALNAALRAIRFLEGPRRNAATLRPLERKGILRLLGSCPWRVLALGRGEEKQRREREQESEGRGEKRRREDRGGQGSRGRERRGKEKKGRRGRGRRREGRRREMLQTPKSNTWAAACAHMCSGPLCPTRHETSEPKPQGFV